MKKETFNQWFYRRCIRADLRAEDTLVAFANPGTTETVTVKNYLKKSENGRASDVLKLVFVTLVCGGILIGIGQIPWLFKGHLNTFLYVTWAVGSVAALYVILLNVASFRWMYRNRKK